MMKPGNVVNSIIDHTKLCWFILIYPVSSPGDVINCTRKQGFTFGNQLFTRWCQPVMSGCITLMKRWFITPMNCLDTTTTKPRCWSDRPTQPKKYGALHCKKHSMTSLHHGSSCLVYPLVNVDITNWKENHHFLAGQINDFYGPFSMSQTVTVITRGYRWPPVL